VLKGPVAVMNADLDGDGTLDLALLDVGTGQVLVWTGDQQLGYQPAISQRDGARTEHQERLTRREREVVQLMEDGYTDREIAARLGVGRRTAESHSASVRAKLGLKSRRELLHRRWPAA
jgi:DNA-binding CsgD family transcriptional regulator